MRLGLRPPALRAGLFLALALLPAGPPGSGGAAAQTAPRVAAPEVAPRPVRVRAVGPIALTVSDADRSVAFYTTVLDFRVVDEVEVAGAEYERLQGVFGLRLRVVRLRLGDELLELHEYLAPRGRPAPVDSRSHDRWFQHVAIVVSDMDRAYRRLRRHKVQHASTGPQLLPASIPAAANIRAFYFRDPDGHFLELLQFPPDKGDARWHRGDGRLFLGIDHTAIVVASTGASLRFYRDLLGLAVAGESRNAGTEQEHLNNVEGARLRITTLRAPEGPGVELLEYLAPRDGRPYPADARANDLIHWQTRLVVEGVPRALARLRGGGGRLLSRGVVEFSHPTPLPGRRVVVRDPDGHALELVEP